MTPKRHKSAHRHPDVSGIERADPRSLGLRSPQSPSVSRTSQSAVAFGLSGFTFRSRLRALG
eukprot:6491687-Alexandrium_andersonii.AAC.1